MITEELLIPATHRNAHIYFRSGGTIEIGARSHVLVMIEIVTLYQSDVTRTATTRVYMLVEVVVGGSWTRPTGIYVRGVQGFLKP